MQRAIYQSLPKDKKKLHPLVNTITQTDDYLQFIEKLNSKNVKPVEEAKKEEIKEVESKSVRTDSMDEPSTQIASVENSPDKKQPPPSDVTPEVTTTKGKEQSNNNDLIILKFRAS